MLRKGLQNALLIRLARPLDDGRMSKNKVNKIFQVCAPTDDPVYQNDEIFSKIHLQHFCSIIKGCLRVCFFRCVMHASCWSRLAAATAAGQLRWFSRCCIYWLRASCGHPKYCPPSPPPARTLFPFIEETLKRLAIGRRYRDYSGNDQSVLSIDAPGDAWPVSSLPA